jgi:hypothetical protein
MAVFIDNAKARCISYLKGEAFFNEEIESNIESNLRVEGEGSDHSRFGSSPYQGSNNEFRKNRQEENLKQTYFKKIKTKISPCSDLLIFGPGQAKKEIFNYIKEDADFNSKKIHVESFDYKTDNQLLERVRLFFND